MYMFGSCKSEAYVVHWEPLFIGREHDALGQTGHMSTKIRQDRRRPIHRYGTDMYKPKSKDNRKK